MALDTYSFRAVDASGSIHKGTVTGDSRDAVVARVRSMGLRPVAVAIAANSFGLSGPRRSRLGGKRADALALFSRQFATMINAGMPLPQCLEVLERQSSDAFLKRAIEEIAAEVQKGFQLSEAMGRQHQTFNSFFCSMVAAGESSGTLGDVLTQLAEATEATAKLRRRIRSAMAYPAAIAVMIVGAVIAMLTLLIPSLADIFASLQGELPLPTRILMAVSDVLTEQLPLVLALFGLTVVGFRRYRATESGRLVLDRGRLRMPVLGKLVNIAAQARFSRSLAVLVHTGVPMVDALRIAATTSGNRVIDDAAVEAAEALGRGQSLSAAMGESEVFEPVVVQMVRVGEETGALDELLDKIADMYDSSVGSTLDSLTSLLEPLLIACMGVTVGGMLLAVYMPMFQLISLVK